MTDGLPQIAFGGDRALSVRVLEFLLSAGCVPRCLLLPEPGKASHDVELAAVFRKAGGSQIHRGREIFSARALQCLRDAELDYIVLVHLQLMIPPEMLAVPRHGVLNLHPAYLPHNRGWHTPSWAILDGTPFGATLHFMDERIDCGDIVHQRQLDVEPADTADSLYRKALDLEFEVFREAWPALAARTYQRRPQPPADGSAHRKAELAGVQQLDLEAVCTPGQLVTRLRALTTNRLDEACYFEECGKKYRVQVRIVPD